MLSRRLMARACLLIAVFGLLAADQATGGSQEDFSEFLQPLLANSCTKCHGGQEINGEVNLGQITTTQEFLAKPKLIDRMMAVIDGRSMPPEGEPQLHEPTRLRMLATLRRMLRQATSDQEVTQAKIRRLNRFQYNNVVKDLFQLKLDVFRLPEKLMTRHDNYLHPEPGGVPVQQLPDRVRVTCDTLNPRGALRGVKAFPKDLRAAHGFDNQANQLTLSPLLLDTFLRLSVSIVESPDFNQQNVGIWNDFFEQPAEDVDRPAEIQRRLGRFLTLAFRRPVDGPTLDRYTSYALSKLDQGLSFPATMKKVASAVLSSPLFFYRAAASDRREEQFELACRLSFFLWGSCPDWELLQLARRGELNKPETLHQTIQRMLADPKIERFLDSFPAQWMQLENVLAATPDPQKHRLFSLDKKTPASVQMVLEPLLLFDAVFVENRPIAELIAPEFGYRSEFLQDWYTTDLKPPSPDKAEIAQHNARRLEHLRSLRALIHTTGQELRELEQALADPIGGGWAAIDLGPGQARWANAAAELVAQQVTLSSWHRIGPFQANNFDQAHSRSFLHEANVDLQKAYGKLKWEQAEDLVDGKVHQLHGQSSATYLYRTIHAPSAGTLELSLGSDDSFKLWLNGVLVADRKVSRGVAPDQDKVQVKLAPGGNTLLMKVVNGGGGYGFYFQSRAAQLPTQVAAALKVQPAKRTAAEKNVLKKHYLAIAPELAQVRKRIAAKKASVAEKLRQQEVQLEQAPRPLTLRQHQEMAQRKFEDEFRKKLRSQDFRRVPTADPRYGGIITNAAMLSMTSGPKRTHPIARGAWMIEVILNDPPPPPPNDVPPLDEEENSQDLTIRERFAAHRNNPTCAGCHSKLDPLGFALENFDVTGRWRDRYENGRDVDATGRLLRDQKFEGVVSFKELLVQEKRRFAKALTGHLLRFAFSRELTPADSLAIDQIVDRASRDDFRLKSLIREVIQSERFLRRL